jgi:hypothetical protein
VEILLEFCELRLLQELMIGRSWKDQKCEKTAQRAENTGEIICNRDVLLIKSNRKDIFELPFGTNYCLFWGLR